MKSSLMMRHQGKNKKEVRVRNGSHFFVIWNFLLVRELLNSRILWHCVAVDYGMSLCFISVTLLYMVSGSIGVRN